MSHLESRFRAAADEVFDLPARPDDATLLELYALYKQATEGDEAGRRPGLFDLRGRAKHDAWAGLAGTSREEAMRRYVEKVEELAAGD